jgi:hypothetical protein
LIPSSDRVRVRVWPGAFRIAVATNDPYQIVEITVSFAYVSSRVAALFRAVCQRLFDPSFVGVDVPQIDRGQKDLHSFLSSPSNDPVGMCEVLFIRRGEIYRNSEGFLAIPVDRPMELMFNQINDDGIETVCTAILQLLLFLFARET